MQTRPAIQVYQLSIAGSDLAAIALGNDELNFYFKTREEAEHYLAAMFPKEVVSSIAEKLATPHNDEWLMLEKTNDFRGGFPKDVNWYRNELAELRNADLIDVITSNVECVVPVRLIDKPVQSQLGGWLNMFSSLWQQPQDNHLQANKELVLDNWGAKNNRPLMLYVSKYREPDFTRDYIIVTTVQPSSSTFKLSAYVLNEDIVAKIKMVDAEMVKLASKNEAELSRLIAKFDTEIVHLSENREALIARDHELFAERHQQKVDTIFTIKKHKFG